MSKIFTLIFLKKRTLILIFSFSCAVSTTPLWSWPISKAQLPQNARVAFMVGTYSPPHIRHDEIFHQLLDSGLVDYVLVVPNDATPHKPFAIDASTRIDMLDAAYRDHPRILYPDSTDVGFPLALKTKSYLKQRFATIRWIGVLGKDSLSNPWAKFGAIFQAVDSWVVFTPDANDEAKIPKKFGIKSITRLYAPTMRDVHSKEIREAAAHEDADALRALLLPGVAKLVMDLGLYREEDPKPRLTDYAGACWRILQKI
jgi:nicotinic acid mononucleotide adenylyltransferase